jgi:hypothetical protein
MHAKHFPICNSSGSFFLKQGGEEGGMGYEVKRVWRYARRRFVIALPNDFTHSINYVLIERDVDRLIVKALHEVKSEHDAYSFWWRV